ncbi:MAG TPA: hypothetical protein VFQ20_12285 [Burkholderiaceae bacterium]|nr:hypothetical protein [Burkholderiaceae bacterium]
MNRRPSFVRCFIVATVALLAGSAAWAQGAAGLRIDDVSTAPRLLARIGVGPHTHAWAGQSGLLLGDYYFSGTRLGRSDRVGGLRATSGVLLGQRAAVLGAPGAVHNTVNDLWAATPYVGLGWTSTSLRGGWGFSADLGLAARTGSGGLRVSPTQSLDDALRELRLLPTIQVGVSYAF